MRHYTRIVALLLVFLCSTTFLCKEVFAEDSNETKKILIDPGHGGFDGGAVSKRGTVEKDINLAIGLKLREKLNEGSYEAFMTRDEDISLNDANGSSKNKKVQDLVKRCKLKEEVKCDLFISIHQNMYPNSNLFGAQVWFANNSKSEFFAKILQNKLINDVDTKNKRVPKNAKDSYKILRDKYDAPCVILECGFLSTPSEEEKLKNSEYQEKIAIAIKESIDEYFKTYTQDKEGKLKEEKESNFIKNKLNKILQ